MKDQSFFIRGDQSILLVEIILRKAFVLLLLIMVIIIIILIIMIMIMIQKINK